jgi:hypothetical protein
VERFNVAPAHSGPLLIGAGVAGEGLTNIVIDLVPVHPFNAVPVTTYVVVTVGVAVTFAPVGEESVPEFDHV